MARTGYKNKQVEPSMLASLLGNRFEVQCEVSLVPERIGYDVRLFYPYYKDKKRVYKIVVFYLEELPEKYTDLEEKFDMILKKLSI